MKHPSLPFDAADYIRSDEAQIELLSDAFDSGDPAYIANALGVIARARSWKGLAEEQPAAYKDVNNVVDVVHRAGLAAKVARMRPIGVVKG